MKIELSAFMASLIASGIAGGVATRVWDFIVDAKRRNWRKRDEHERWLRDQKFVAYTAFGSAMAHFVDGLFSTNRHIAQNQNAASASPSLPELRTAAFAAFGPIGLLAPQPVITEAHNYLLATSVLMENLPFDRLNEEVGKQLSLLSSLWRLAANNDLGRSDVENSFSTSEAENLMLLALGKPLRPPEP